MPSLERSPGNNVAIYNYKVDLIMKSSDLESFAEYSITIYKA